jgi:hypothetical protein
VTDVSKAAVSDSRARAISRSLGFLLLLAVGVWMLVVAATILINGQVILVHTIYHRLDSVFMIFWGALISAGSSYRIYELWRSRVSTDSTNG